MSGKVISSIEEDRQHDSRLDFILYSFLNDGFPKLLFEYGLYWYIFQSPAQNKVYPKKYILTAPSNTSKLQYLTI